MTDDAEIQKLIQAVDKAESANGLLEAVKALAAVRSLAAIPTLIDVLRYNNPGAAVAAVDGLIELSEAAVQPILEKLDSYNYGARSWATRALAGIGDPRSLDLLIAAAKDDFALSVRRSAARGLGNIQWSRMPVQQAIDAQMQVFQTLLQVSQDPEWVVRYAAVVGLHSLAIALAPAPPKWFEEILTLLQQIATTDPDLAVRARSGLAKQGVIGNG